MVQTIKVGDRVELLFINDTWTKLQKGDKGKVFKIENNQEDGLIWIEWDNGERLALIQGIDKFKIVKK